MSSIITTCRMPQPPAHFATKLQQVLVVTITTPPDTSQCPPTRSCSSRTRDHPFHPPVVASPATMSRAVTLLCAAALLLSPAAALVLQSSKVQPAIDGNDVPYCTAPGIYNATLDNMLIASKDMPVQIVEINAAIPLADLWAYVCVE